MKITTKYSNMSFHFRLLCSPVPPLESDAIRKRLVGTLRSGPWSFQKCSKKGMGRGINCKFYKDSNYRATFILWYNFSSAVCEDEKKYNNLEKKTLKLWLPITKLKIKIYVYESFGMRKSSTLFEFLSSL